MTFENNLGTLIFWRLSWGGDSYTGDTTGSIINDPDGEFGPPWPGPLPSDGVQALQFQGSGNDSSTNNADDYALTAGAATFTNNAGESATVVSGAPCEWDCGDGDGQVAIVDLLALLSEWGGPGDCDFDASGAVDIVDLLKLLAKGGPCP